MRPMARSVALGLAIAPLLMSPAQAGGGPTEPDRVDCTTASGVDPATAEALCLALRDAHAGDALRLHILSTGPATLSARLDLMTDQGALPGPPLQFSVMDRDLTPDDFRNFARDLLRFGLTQP